MFSFIWQKQENQEWDSSFRATASPLFSFPIFLTHFLPVLYQSLREVMTFNNMEAGLSSREDGANRMGVVLAQTLSSLSALSLLTSFSLLLLSAPGLFPAVQASLSERREAADCFAPGFCSSVSCILFPNACDSVEEFPSQPFPGIPCVPWQDGRKPIRLYEADNHRCF